MASEQFTRCVRPCPCYIPCLPRQHVDFGHGDCTLSQLKWNKQGVNLFLLFVSLILTNLIQLRGLALWFFPTWMRCSYCLHETLRSLIWIMMSGLPLNCLIRRSNWWHLKSSWKCLVWIGLMSRLLSSVLNLMKATWHQAVCCLQTDSFRTRQWP